MHIPGWAERMDQLAAEGIPFLFILDFKLASPIVMPLKDIGNSSNEFSGIRYSVNQVIGGQKLRTKEISFLKEPVSFEDYKLGFDQVMSALKAGDTYLPTLFA